MRPKGTSCWHEVVETLKQACFQGYPESARYVQISIGSRNSAIHNAYRTSLRPSSLFEPRHPSLKVVNNYFSGEAHQMMLQRCAEAQQRKVQGKARQQEQSRKTVQLHPAALECPSEGIDVLPPPSSPGPSQEKCTVVRLDACE